LNNIIQEILKSKHKLYLSLTGGGTKCISLLLENGGASSVFLGASIPYCEEDLRWNIGPYSKAVSRQVAEKMSYGCISKSVCDSLEGEDRIISIGVTASLAKAGKEREDRVHEAYICIHEIKEHTIKEPENKIKILKEFHITFSHRARLDEETALANTILFLANSEMNLTKSHILTHKPSQKLAGLLPTDKLELL